MQPHQPEPLLAKRAALRQTHHARRNGPPRRRRAAPPAAGMSLGWGWGADGGGRKQDGAAPQPPPPAGGPPTTGEEESGSSSDEPLPLEVARFIATASGVKWLSDTLKDWPDMLVGAKGRLDQTRDRIQRAPHHLNKFVVREYRKLVRSELGEQ
ncbi:hypothetical protein Rsub_00564 [Raphidocelis subcapitata]|uniref:Uncharacterized protein n=1 Tax=Raphidocelis subcapitata TaxID=307507 RepID=A0A2V0NN23_9CHLO|nr:hypothetical protein Rsub_00564 [Raphidocelis subcapitata]|eukprot:GBF87852.1 hypothetical protein Rsub_00564 [Raphidocelis subcapitata]